MVGIQETKEVLVAVNELALVIVKYVKDGVSVTDIPAIVSELIGSDSFKLKLTAAITNISQVPAEIGNIDLLEGGELAVCQASYLPRILAALKK